MRQDMLTNRLGSTPATTPAGRQKLLHVSISAGYPAKPDVLSEITFDIEPGEIVGLIGESGSGKSTLALSLLRLLDRNGGTVRGEVVFGGRHLERLAERDMRQIRGREIALVSQSAVASLNPALRIGAQFAEAWKAHDRSSYRRARHSAVLEMLERVGLPGEERFLRLYPRQLSVGQAQRVLIALAVLHRPRLLIADEPTSALDAITKAEVVDLIKELNQEIGMAVLFISHDLLLVGSLCRRVAILNSGQIVESGPTNKVFSCPEHPYTRALLDAIAIKSRLLASAYSDGCQVDVGVRLPSSTV